LSGQSGFSNKLGMSSKNPNKPQTVKAKKIAKRNLGSHAGSTGPASGGVNLPSSILQSRIIDSNEIPDSLRSGGHAPTYT